MAGLLCGRYLQHMSKPSPRLCKFLSLVLHHDPARIELVLDEGGWADVGALMAACAAHGVRIDRADLEALAWTSDRPQLVLSPDGLRVRAARGDAPPAIPRAPERPASVAPIEPSPAGRVDRKVQAEQTIAACEAGWYTNLRGERVELHADITAARAGTTLHKLGEELSVPSARGPTRIAVTAESTLEALIRLSAEPGGSLACLNFASARNPGGGFLGGAQAQEESLARASALYPCLLTQPDHYERNRAQRSCLYLDLALYSPAVPFFCDDLGAWLDRPVLASVITCAAPNASALRQHKQFDSAEVERVLRRRAGFVLAIGAHHGVRRLVLGAWGAGVFGNDPGLVAEAFGTHLAGEFRSVFAEVVFAIRGGPGKPNYDAFAARFGSS